MAGGRLNKDCVGLPPPLKGDRVTLGQEIRGERVNPLAEGGRRWSAMVGTRLEALDSGA